MTIKKRLITRIVSIFLLLALVAGLVPGAYGSSFALAGEDADPTVAAAPDIPRAGEDDDPTVATAPDIPRAEDMSHQHNMPGWECIDKSELTCEEEEHEHSLSECYELSEEPICGYKEGEGGHTHEDSCYEETYVCSPDPEEEHEHSDECVSRELVCGYEEGEGGHTHDEICYAVLTCDKEEHVHGKDCYRYWTECSTEFSLVTVEYFINVNGQVVRSGDTYQSLQATGSPYKVSIEDLSEKGYVFSHAQGWLRNGDEAQELAADGTDNGFEVSGEGTSMNIKGTLVGDTLIRVFYEYTEELAPYQGNYFGGAATGSNDVLLYSYISYGIKDTTAEMEIDIAKLVATMLDALNSDEVKQDKGSDQSGPEFVKALVEYVSKQYDPNDPKDPYLRVGTGEDAHEYLRHDVTPLLKQIALWLGKSEDDYIVNLTRKDVKQYMTDIGTKFYGLDKNRGSAEDKEVMVTADRKAEKNFYYIEGAKTSVTFITGAGSAHVTGIPKSVKLKPDEDGVITDYGIESEENRIVAYAGVDISAYTQEIAAESNNYEFVGWHTDTAFGGAIFNYSASSTQYKDLDLITTEELAEKLTVMPSVNTSYYAVWQALSAPYVVQLWFETDEEGTYQESHSYDMNRTGPMNSTVKYNDFDKTRADETAVIAAANGEASFPVIFQDSGEGASGKTDIYYTWSDYTNGTFYGYDILEDGVTPTKLIGVDGSDSNTTGNTQNGEEVTIREDGKTVLNVFYKREVWTIKVHPAVEIYQYSEATDYATGGHDKLFINGQGGRLMSDIAADIAENDTVITFSGRFGTELTNDTMDDTGKYKFGDLFSGSSVKIDEGTKSGNNSYPYPSQYYIEAGSDVTFTSFANQGPDDKTDYGYRTKTYDHDVVMNYQGLTTLDPSMFANVKDKSEKEDRMFYMYDSQNTTTFGYTSDYKFDDDGNLQAVEYGTRTLDVYPHYLNAYSSADKIDPQIFYVDYYVQTLPDGSDNTKGLPTYTYNGSSFIKYGVETDSKNNNLTHTLSFTKNAWMSTYTVEVPEGFTALAWRAGTVGFKSDFDITPVKSLDAYWRNTKAFKSPSQVSNSSVDKNTFCIAQNMGTVAGTVQPNFSGLLGAEMLPVHDTGFNDNNIVRIGDTSFYTSDWMIRYVAHSKDCPYYDPNSIEYNTPDGYYNMADWWITDFARTSTGTASLDGTLTGENGYKALVEAAEEGDTDSQSLLSQLRDTIVVGNLYASGITTYRVTQAPATPSGADTSKFEFKLSSTNFNTRPANPMNAVIFARNHHAINFWTCYLDGKGKLVRDDGGNITMAKVNTEPTVYYDQALTDYYKAYFTVDDEGNPTFVGYSAAAVSDAEGGYGKWYLDPDGTIPFTEKNLAKMPDGDINVYYHYSGVTYDVYFVDDQDDNGNHQIPDKTIIDPDFYGTGKPRTVEHVYDNQVVRPNEQATVPDPEPTDDKYLFGGWFSDEDRTIPFDFNKEITEDTVVYAKWIPKVPTQYTVRHILVDENGDYIRDVVDPFNGDGLVGETINAKALGTEVYHDGMWFVPDFYSATKVLVKDPKNNELVFKYRLPQKSYTVHYVIEGTYTDIVDPDGPTNTTLSSVTVKYKDLSELGWELVDDQYKTKFIPNGKHVDIYFEYRKSPDPIIPGLTKTSVTIVGTKYLDGELPEGERFTFTLDGADGTIETVHAVNGLIEFSALEFEETGKYEFTVSEKATDEKGIFFDKTVYTIIVDIKSDDLGALYAEVSVKADGEDFPQVPVFYNLNIPYIADAPTTGDSSQLGLWLTVLGLSFAGLLAGVFIIVKKNGKFTAKR